MIFFREYSTETIPLDLSSSALPAYRGSKVLCSHLMLLQMSSVNMTIVPTYTDFTSGLRSARHSRSEGCLGLLET